MVYKGIMDLKDKAEIALANIDKKLLYGVHRGDVIELNATSRTKIPFTVTSIKRGHRGWVVSLRLDNGLEWGIPGIRWTGQES